MIAAKKLAVNAGKFWQELNSQVREVVTLLRSSGTHVISSNKLNAFEASINHNSLVRGTFSYLICLISGGLRSGTIGN